jgi:hypothetical protein
MKHSLPPFADQDQATEVQTVRVTVPVRQDVLDTFQRLAKAGSMSTGRAMGEWLADTIEAAEFMAKKLEQARAAPRIVAREMHAYALGLADETGAVLERVRAGGRTATGASGEARAPGRAARPNPPSNTGVTTSAKKPGRGQR